MTSDPSPILYGVVGLFGVFVLGPWLARFFGGGHAFARAVVLLAVGAVYVGHLVYNALLTARAVANAERRFKLVEPMIQAHPEARICPACFQLEIESK